MKRFHVHVRVKNLNESIEFYNALFNTQPAIVKSDYAKWMLEDPRINYAISTGHSESGIEHLGLQLENEAELQEVYENMQKAKGTVREEGECTCCYWFSWGRVMGSSPDVKDVMNFYNKVTIIWFILSPGPSHYIRPIRPRAKVVRMLWTETRDK